MPSQYDEQAKFLANKMKEIALIELRSAVDKEELRYLKAESVDTVAEIIYWYYMELNRPYGGGVVDTDINGVIEAALTSYKYAKAGRSSTTFLPNDEWKKLLDETETAFKNNVAGLNVELEGCTLEDMQGQAPHLFVPSPTFSFPYIGNAAAFACDMHEKSGLVVREQYFDNNGRILQNPVVTYCVNGTWQEEPPSKLIPSTCKNKKKC